MSPAFFIFFPPAALCRLVSRWRLISIRLVLVWVYLLVVIRCVDEKMILPQKVKKKKKETIAGQSKNYSLQLTSFPSPMKLRPRRLSLHCPAGRAQVEESGRGRKRMGRGGGSTYLHINEGRKRSRTQTKWREGDQRHATISCASFLFPF